jgi:hypothetical protein
MMIDSIAPDESSPDRILRRDRSTSSRLLMRALDKRPDIDFVAQQAGAMNLRSSGPHLEEVTVLDLQLVRRLAIGTMHFKAATQQPIKCSAVRLDAGLDYTPAFGA